MLMRQVHLSNGTRRVTCWVGDDPRLRVGRFLRLKSGGTELPAADRQAYWRIEAIHGVEDLAELNRTRGWNIGGLGRSDTPSARKPPSEMN
jgi:hypothetical protein